MGRVQKVLISMAVLTSVVSSPACAKEERPFFWPFPPVWTCPCCGYENYEGINYCATCGEICPEKR